jgi:RHS repeat-associated protein
MADGPNATCSPTCQYREFLYDGLGNLRGESHPELSGSVGLGSRTFNVVHDLYDARGNPGRRRDGRSTLGYHYDFAGRPITVSDDAEPPLPGPPLQEFFYADRNRNPDGSWAPSGPDKTAGKLFQARQHQWLSRGDPGAARLVTVTETFGYQGAGGRLSDYSVRSYSPSSEQAASYPSLRFTSKLAYNSLGLLSRLTYPRCKENDTEHCPVGDPERVVENLYSRGWLTGVQNLGGSPAYASGITYHPSGLPHEIPHGNGVTVVQAEDPKGRPRPKSIATQGVLSNQNWASGDHLYDTLGNIYGIGPDQFLYDEVNRIVEGRLASAGPLKVQRYTYDVFANLRSIADDSDTIPGNGEPPPQTLAVQAATNRLGPAQATYDASGNVTAAPFLNLDGATWDPLGRLTSVRGTGLNRQFLYSAFGERLAVFDSLPPPSVCGSACLRDTWTVRGPGRKVLRDYTRTLPSGGPPSWSSKDYIYRGGALLASVEGAETRHFHLDHLGSPRLISGQDKSRKAYHVYYPYGREATSRTQDTERLKFTGHERDFQTEGQIANTEADDLDYMHARYYSPWVGRFLSVDPVMGRTGIPQGWNRYSYGLDNPVVLTDPSGKCPICLQAPDLFIGYVVDRYSYFREKGAVGGYTVSGAIGDGAAVKLEAGVVIDSDGKAGLIFSFGAGGGGGAALSFNGVGTEGAKLEDLQGVGAELDIDAGYVGGGVGVPMMSTGADGAEFVDSPFVTVEGGVGVGLGAFVTITQTYVVPLFDLDLGGWLSNTESDKGLLDQDYVPPIDDDPY